MLGVRAIGIDINEESEVVRKAVGVGPVVETFPTAGPDYCSGSNL